MSNRIKKLVEQTSLMKYKNCICLIWLTTKGFIQKTANYSPFVDGGREGSSKVVKQRERDVAAVDKQKSLRILFINYKKKFNSQRKEGLAM